MNAAIEVILAISRVEVERAPPAPSGRQEGARVLQNALSPEHLVQLESQEERSAESLKSSTESLKSSPQRYSVSLAELA
jgi:hypothetical protein